MSKASADYGALKQQAETSKQHTVKGNGKLSITVEAKETAGLEAGAYEGQIAELVEETGEYGDQIKFIIEVDGLTDSKGEAVNQWAWASKTLSPKSKLWKWIKNVTGVTPTIGGTFDVEDALLGQRVGFLVSINEGGRSVVTDLFKPRTAGTTRAAAPATAAKPATDEVCAVDGCGEALDHYTKKGKPLCSQHTAEDL